MKKCLGLIRGVVCVGMIMIINKNILKTAEAKDIYVPGNYTTIQAASIFRIALGGVVILPKEEKAYYYRPAGNKTTPVMFVVL